MEENFPGEGIGSDSVDLGFLDRGGVVTARGTGDGLILRLDGRVPHETLRSAVVDFLSSRRAFLGGNEVAIEWVGAKPSDILITELSDLLSDEFGITVKASRLKELRGDTRGDIRGDDSKHGTLRESIEVSSVHDISSARERRELESDKTLGLFGGVENLAFADEELASKGSGDGRGDIRSGSLSETKGGAIAEAFLWDDPDARMIYATLRSGQKIETEHSLVVFGDVNSGAEVVAGGDIVVLGTLRGVAHAGAYDETGGGRFIMALNLQPTQLRIGSVISRGSSEGQKSAEIARVEANMIVVETYQSRSFVARRRA